MATKTTMCLSCTEVDSYDLKDENHLCRKCGFSINNQSYVDLIEYASDVIEHGYHYRRVYEKDLKKGKLNSRYSLSIDDVWIFISLAILSGIIGNAAWDTVKLAIGSIIKSFENSGKKSYFKIDPQIFENERKFAEIVEYINHYHSNFIKNLDPKVAAALLEEMIVDETLRLRPYLMDGERRLKQDEIRELHKQALINVVTKKEQTKFKTEEFQEFWKNLNS